MYTKSNKWNQNVINFLVTQKLIHFLKYVYYTCYLNIYLYKSFSTMLDKVLRKNIKKKEMEKLENIN